MVQPLPPPDVSLKSPRRRFSNRFLLVVIFRRMKREGGLGVETWVLPLQNSHGTGQIQEVKSLGECGGRRKEWQVDRWGRRRRRRSKGLGAVCRSCLGLLALVGVMEPLSRVSGGPWCPPRPCTPTARLRASATSQRNRIFLEDRKKQSVFKVRQDNQSFEIKNHVQL